MGTAKAETEEASETRGERDRQAETEEPSEAQGKKQERQRSHAREDRGAARGETEETSRARDERQEDRGAKRDARQALTRPHNFRARGRGMRDKFEPFLAEGGRQRFWETKTGAYRDDGQRSAHGNEGTNRFRHVHPALAPLVEEGSPHQNLRSDDAVFRRQQVPLVTASIVVGLGLTPNNRLLWR